MAWTPQYQQRYQPTQQPQQQAQQQMPQQQMPQQMPQQQYQNPAANWQQTYQNSQWYRPNPYQQNPYQSQMPQQMPQQYQQQQMPQFSQQQINSFLNFMRSRPMPNFMGDPRYQAQQAEKPVYQPPPTPTARTFMPKVRFEGGGGTGMFRFGGTPTVGDAAADAWVKGKAQELQIQRARERGGSAGATEADYQNLYNQYFSGAA
jgi:hypothetical protein